MKVYTPLQETSTYRNLFDSYNTTVDNLNSTDFLYKSNLSDGRVFSDQVGYINLQEAHMGQSVTIAAADLGDFKIRGFVYYSRKYNTYKVMDINCDLTGYKDNRVHFLYVLMQTGGTYEVYDNMQENTDERMLFARFVIDTSGNSVQFFLAAPFAGTPDYVKSNPTFEVMNGLKGVGTSSNTLILGKGKIRFPGINFDNKADPDVLTLDTSSEALPLRYVTWDSVNSRPTVNWGSGTVTNFDFSKMMNFSTGAITNVANNKTTIQKVYFDPYTKSGVVEYGNVAYNSLEDAMKVLGTVASYPLIDGVKYLIPLVAIVNKKGNTDLTEEEYCSVVSLTPNEELIFGLDQASQQMALEAQIKAQQAIDTVGNVQTSLSNHIANVSNPHNVTRSQLGISDTLANKTLTQIYSGAAQYILDNNSLNTKYLPLAGGTITGTLTVNSTITARSNVSITGSLSAGTSTLGATTVGSLTSNGNVTVNSGGHLQVNSYAAITGDLTAANVTCSSGALSGKYVNTSSSYVTLGGVRLYLGSLPGDARPGDYAIYVS